MHSSAQQHQRQWGEVTFLHGPATTTVFWFITLIVAVIASFILASPERIGSRYVSGRTRAWLKTKNPDSSAAENCRPDLPAYVRFHNTA